MKKSTAPSMLTRLVASPRQISCAVGDEAVLLNIDDGEYYSLNPVAATVWRLLEQPATLETVRNELLAQYAGISTEDCEREIVELVGQLIALGMVESV